MFRSASTAFHQISGDPLELEDVAAELWRDRRLRALPPAEAATDWLRPIAPTRE